MPFCKACFEFRQTSWMRLARCSQRAQVHPFTKKPMLHYHEKSRFMRMNSLRELQKKWDRASRWYELATVALEALVFRRMRSRLLKSAAGRVLEVAAGSGF
jgi:hypothetical protein